MRASSSVLSLSALLLSFASFASFAGTACVAQAPESIDETSLAMANGTIAPSMSDGTVFLRFNNDDHACTGVLLRRQWVLTAAHCVLDVQGRPISGDQVFVTETKQSQYKPVYTPQGNQVFVHPGYLASSQPPYDLALIRLATPSSLPNSYVRATYGGTTAQLVGANLRCYGYGMLLLPNQQGVVDDDNLRTGSFKVMMDSGSGRALIGSTQAQVRNGDSGGPCIRTDTNELAGVFSWSPLTAGDTTAIMAVTQSDWIYRTLEGTRVDANAAAATVTSHQPSVVKAPGGSWTALVVRDDSGALRFKYESGQTWYPSADFDRIPLPVAVDGDPTALFIDGTLTVFATGVDRQLWVARWLWNHWEYLSLGGQLDSSPAAVSIAAGRADVFAVDYSTKLLARVTYKAGAWGTWAKLSGMTLRGATKPAAATVTTAGTGVASIVAVGADGALKNIELWPGGFTSCSGIGIRTRCLLSDYSSWTDLGEQVYGDPSIVSATATRVTVGARHAGDLHVVRKLLALDGSFTVTQQPWLSDAFSPTSSELVSAYDRIYAVRFGVMYSCYSPSYLQQFPCNDWQPDQAPSVAHIGGWATLGLVGTDANGQVWEMRN